MKIFMVMILAVVFTGCSTLQDAKSAKGTGTSESFAHSFDEVWGTAISVVNESKLDLVSENKEQGEILAQKGVSAFSYGENVAIYVEEKSQEDTKVEVISKKAMSTNIFAKNWSGYILDKIREALE